ERASYLAGHAVDGCLRVLAVQDLPHSLGLLYEEVTGHLGFQRSSDEYKVMALAAYGRPVHLPLLRGRVRTRPDGGYRVDPVDWSSLAPGLPAGDGEGWGAAQADLAASVQARLEEVLLELASWLHART